MTEVAFAINVFELAGHAVLIVTGMTVPGGTEVHTPPGKEGNEAVQLWDETDAVNNTLKIEMMRIALNKAMRQTPLTMNLYSKRVKYLMGMLQAEMRPKHNNIQGDRICIEVLQVESTP